jgi:flagellar biosynthetic protein FliR
MISLAIATALGPSLPPPPPTTAGLVMLVGGEVLIGLFIGAAARTLLAALHVGGTIISMQSGLAAASYFDPSQATQGTLPGNLLTTTALVLLFVTDTHHMLLQALAASYERFTPGAFPPMNDIAQTMTRFVSEAFVLGARIAAPLMLLSLLLYLGMGILNRLMPAFQVFFVAIPLQLLLALAVISLSLGGGLIAFFTLFEDGIGVLVLGS